MWSARRIGSDGGLAVMLLTRGARRVNPIWTVGEIQAYVVNIRGDRRRETGTGDKVLTREAGRGLGGSLIRLIQSRLARHALSNIGQTKMNREGDLRSCDEHSTAGRG